MRLSLPGLSLLTVGLLGCHIDLTDHCTDTAHREARIDLTGIHRVVLDAGAGELHVTGRSDGSTLEADGMACASSASTLEDVQIFHEVRGQDLHLWTHKDHGVTVHVGWSNDAARLDLNVQLPSAMPIEIEDGSGDAVIKSVGELSIEDGSGNLDLADLRGNAKIEDGSGDLDIVGVDGHVILDDGSGEIRITGVKGDVRLEDGSGNARIRQVGGQVEITEDGSGDLEIVGASRGVHVRVDGSGNLTIREVTGDVRVDEDGSGDLEVSGVTGEVTIPENKRRR